MNKVPQDECNDDTLCPCCPHKNETYETLCEHSNTSVILKRLISVISDSEGRYLIGRQNLLLNHYFGLSSNRLKMIDVEYVSILLEFLCENLQDNPPYKNVLWRLLTICQKPPYLTRFSDAQDAPTKLANYFSALGNCLIFLDDPNLKIMIVNVIYHLLDEEEDPSGLTVPFFHRKAGLDMSQMGEKLLQIIKIESDVIYPHILDLILKIVILSKECAQTLFIRDGIHWLLTRLDISDEKPQKNSHLRETTSIVIWKLLDCVGEKKVPSNIQLHNDNLKMMKLWLRSETLFGKLSSRNDVAALICRVLYAYPHLDSIISSGIIEDICLLATATEFGAEESWASTVKFVANRENLEFKKLLTVSIVYHYHLSGVRMIAEEYGFLPSMALVLNPYFPSMALVWPPAYKWELINYALHSLPTLGQYNPKKYIECSVTTRIVFLIEYFSTEKESPELIKCSLHCIHSLLLRGIGGEHFRNHNLIAVLLGLGYHILKGNLTLRAQINLTYCFFILTILHKDYAPRFHHYELMIALALEILNRIIKSLDTDSKFDGSMVVAAVDYVWNCVIKQDELRKSYIQQGGIYLLLDLANITSLPVQTLIFGALSDATLDVNSVPQIITWRGRTEQDTIVALMCSIWRKQEAVKGVKRHLHDCINDYDHVLSGTLQRKLEPDFSTCASIVEMYGCARPKIFSVHSNIFRLHSNVADRVMSAYTLNCNHVSFKDKITEEIILYYEFFKKGEIWADLKKAIKHKNIQLLPQGEIVLNILSYRHLFTAVQVQKKQLNHYWTEVSKEESEEENLYYKLKSCMLAKALESLNEIRFELFCSDSNFAKKARANIEESFKKTRKKNNLEQKSNTYHTASVVGLNISRAKPSGFTKSKYNSRLPPKEFLMPVVEEEEKEEKEKEPSTPILPFKLRHRSSVEF